ncbi:DUF2490 domain-containing protein [Lewinella sp. JB7]|uniref:DUF2490 domain-containing protein n=1 Tax=Lewinella sp. JB7 TaxID=2962887 RepID=UPI0020C9B204|nr:DUF2490 domain-containing protein [Lewinella sp. JB7]MCP9237470.1 DUF2490 domain-containing protein [Lewinella sp. JB7]
MRLPYFLLLAVAWVALPVAHLPAQSKKVLHDTEEGVRYLNQFQLHHRWTLQSDVGFRWRTGLRELSQHMVRTAGVFRISPLLRAAAGYAYAGRYDDGKVRVVEHRPFQEASIGHQLWGIPLSHRLRIEERFFRFRATNSPVTSAFFFRPRYALRLRILQLSLSRTHPNRRLSLTVGDEVLLQMGGGNDYGAQLRNRILLSPSLELNDRFALSLSYTQQSAPTDTPGVFRRSELLWLVVRHRVGTEGS